MEAKTCGTHMLEQLFRTGTPQSVRLFPFPEGQQQLVWVQDRQMPVGHKAMTCKQDLECLLLTLLLLLALLQYWARMCCKDIADWRFSMGHIIKPSPTFLAPRRFLASEIRRRSLYGIVFRYSMLIRWYKRKNARFFQFCIPITLCYTRPQWLCFVFHRTLHDRNTAYLCPYCFI